MTLKYLKTALGFTERVLFPYIIALAIVPGLSWYFSSVVFLWGPSETLNSPRGLWVKENLDATSQLQEDPCRYEDPECCSPYRGQPGFPLPHGYTFIWLDVKFLNQALSQDATLPGECEKLERAL